MNRRKSRNKIDSLLAQDGTWGTDRDSLSSLLNNHFQKIMTTSTPADSHHFLQHIPQCITDEHNQELEAIPTDQEIHQALMTMEPWTSPGSDRFPPDFYQTQWKLVKDDVCKMIKFFFHSGFFSSRRVISENTCLVKEIVQATKRKEGMTSHLALKMDMYKAFDRLEWSFLLDILKQFGFSEKFRQLISQCISITQIEILLNGCETSSFKSSRAIRQGDPLSLYLFILAMESFSRYMA
ncbi:uncharacterized protein LOC113272244 [Papaver somniferum]|uniref:uncharacterized protein LOC113272244 n=1 Tax=Papaver somniferum TaxID=3469 RepID=UPI000E6F70C9|nr:uncharacterized protein LOC113272244 [Papaver somniferum]